MKKKNKQKSILIYCPSCKKKHRMIIGKCLECGIYETFVPESNWVLNHCCAYYRCEGCEAYQEHLSIY